jgi:hypothetical protein
LARPKLSQPQQERGAGLTQALRRQLGTGELPDCARVAACTGPRWCNARVLLVGADELGGGDEVESPDGLVQVTRPDPQPVLRGDADVVLRAVQAAGPQVHAVPLALLRWP